MTALGYGFPGESGGIPESVPLAEARERCGLLPKLEDVREAA